MRLYHPRTLEIFASRPDIPKRYSCSAWSEIFKWKAGGKSHPKMFLLRDFKLGVYMRFVYDRATKKGCALDKSKLEKLGKTVLLGFNGGCYYITNDKKRYMFLTYCDFDNNYLFSDACSLYYKGINIFPDIFGDQWRKYVPVESHKEIIRQCEKTVT
jgi:hypothetical protein